MCVRRGAGENIERTMTWRAYVCFIGGGGYQEEHDTGGVLVLHGGERVCLSGGECVLRGGGQCVPRLEGMEAQTWELFYAQAARCYSFKLPGVLLTQKLLQPQAARLSPPSGYPGALSLFEPELLQPQASRLTPPSGYPGAPPTCAIPAFASCPLPAPLGPPLTCASPA